MNSYFFHGGGTPDPAVAAFLAKPPPEYARFTIDRAMWQALGKRPEEMTVIEYELAKTFILAEDERDRPKTAPGRAN